MLLFGGDHQCGATAVVAILDTRAAIEEQSGSPGAGGGGGSIVTPGSPHERGKATAAARVDVDAVGEEPGDNSRRAASGSLDDRRLAGLVPGRRVAAADQHP